MSELKQNLPPLPAAMKWPLLSSSAPSPLSSIVGGGVDWHSRLHPISQVGSELVVDLLSLDGLFAFVCGSRHLIVCMLTIGNGRGFATPAG